MFSEEMCYNINRRRYKSKTHYLYTLNECNICMRNMFLIWVEDKKVSGCKPSSWGDGVPHWFVKISVARNYRDDGFEKESPEFIRGENVN